MTILQKVILGFNAIPIKIPMAFFHTTRTNNSKIRMKTQKTQNSQTILRKKNKNWKLTNPGFKLYYKDTDQ